MFKKTEMRAPRPGAAERAMSGSTFSILGGDVTVAGDIRAETDLHVDGRVDGDITCAALVQGEASEIRGAITADSARLAGTVRGTVTVRELVILRTARIEGDVHYDALTVEQGAQINGRFSPRTNPIPAANDEPEAKLILAS